MVQSSSLPSDSQLLRVEELIVVPLAVSTETMRLLAKNRNFTNNRPAGSSWPVRRRARLVPPELDADPNVIELCADHVKSAVAGWRQCLQQNGINLAQAKFLEAQRQALQQLEEKTRAEKLSEEAELLAVIRYIEKWGVAPAGYELIEDDFENSSSTATYPDSNN